MIKISNFSKKSFVFFALTFLAVGSYLLFTSHASNLSGDINSDGAVNTFDLSLLLSSYGQSRTTCATATSDICDLNNDGNINIFDLSILLSNWGRTVTAQKLKVGVMNIGNYNYSPYNEAPIFKNAGITYTREDVGNGADTGTCTGADYTCTALRNGVTPIVLFEGYADSNMSTEVVNLANKLNTLAANYSIMNNMHVIEFGNEMWQGTSGPSETASTYGAQYDTAHKALANVGLGSWKLLAAATAICGDQNSSPTWINQVIAAQSGGASEIDGWTVHPYGPMNTDLTTNCSGPHGYGWPDVNDWHTIAVNAGSNAPWYVTEVGQCIGGSSCGSSSVSEGSCTDSAGTNTQAGDMRQYLTDAGGDTRTAAQPKYPWVAALIWYQVFDDSTGWWGLLGGNGVGPNEPLDYQRPAFCEMQQWIQANGEG